MLLVSRGDDLERAIAFVRAVCDQLASLVVVVCVSEPTLSLGEPDLVALERALEAGDADIEHVRERLGASTPVTGEVLVGRPRDVLARAMRQRPDLVVLVAPDAKRDELAGCALEAARAYRVAAVCAGSATVERPVRRLLHPFDGRAESLASVGALLRDRCDAEHHVLMIPLGPLDARLAGEPQRIAAVAGVHARIEVAAVSDLPATLATLQRLPFDAVLLSVEAAAFAEGLALHVALRALSRGPWPLLFAPSVSARPVREGQLDALDAVVVGDALSIRVERLAAFGAPSVLPDAPIELVAAGLSLGTVEAHEGVLAVPRVLEREQVIGLGRSAPGLDPLGALEVTVTVAPLGTERVALIDARLGADALVHARAALGARTVLAVRLAPDVSARELRARFLAAGFDAVRVVDVRDLLDEGEPIDVPSEVAAVRVARAAARLRAAGTQVDVVVALDPAHAAGSGFSIVSAQSIDRAKVEAAFAPARAAGSLGERLDALTASRSLPGHRIRVELDNADARRSLVALIGSAKERVHAQWYIVEDDEITREVEAALAHAAARGVAIRVLIDSLYSLHGSLGAQNPLLGRLSHMPGVVLLSSRPIDHLPSIEDLKQRDHRKLMVVDGERAVVSGRNLGRAYYRSFAEARVSATSTHHDLPWLDASVALAGPGARVLDASFREAWSDAGGEPFALVSPAPVGAIEARVIVHRGLRDAYTLEAYRAVIEAARERLIVVNSFPLQFELQHALLAALRRGVRLSLLVGRARPSHELAGGADVPFAGAPYHGIADVLVRARLSSLVAAGADVRELVVPPPSGWEAALGAVRPHVHAKIVCADSAVLAIGSANLDVTAGYWESEVLVVLENPGEVAGVATELEALLAGSSAIDPEDAKWLEGAALREWLGRVWPSLLA